MIARIVIVRLKSEQRSPSGKGEVCQSGKGVRAYVQNSPQLPAAGFLRIAKCRDRPAHLAPMAHLQARRYTEC